uniref:Uncharacterized protein n=1 Tax=Leersia perrieri TaxID=77586 RepID=A0A0D9XS53_9ORYZ
MQEFRLAGSSLLHFPIMEQFTSSGSSNTDAIIAMSNDGGLSAALTQVVPDSSWLIYHIYMKRRHAPQVIIPPAFGNAGEFMIPPAVGNTGGGQVRFIDFSGQASRVGPSSPSCSIGMTKIGMAMARGIEVIKGSNSGESRIKIASVFCTIARKTCDLHIYVCF